MFPSLHYYKLILFHSLTHTLDHLHDSFGLVSDVASSGISFAHSSVEELPKTKTEQSWPINALLHQDTQTDRLISPFVRNFQRTTFGQQRRDQENWRPKSPVTVQWQVWREQLPMLPFWWDSLKRLVPTPLGLLSAGQENNQMSESE